MIIFNYISRELYTTLVGILIVLLIIFMTNQFVHFMQYASTGYITMTAVFQLMALQIPFLLGYLMPLAMYLSILIVFARLYMDHEMTVMSACGVSPSYLLAVVLTVGVLVAVVTGVLMIWLQPFLDLQRTNIFYESVAKATVEKVIPKRFQNLSADMVFYADDVERGELKMHNIFFAHRGKPAADGSRPWDITISKNAQDAYQDAGHFLLFEDGFRYLGEPGQFNYQVVQYQSYGVRIAPEAPVKKGWPSNASTASIWPQRHIPRVASELQWRMAIPVSALVLALLAFPLSRVNPRRGRFSQLIPAIILYIAYGNLLFLGRSWLGKGEVSFEVGLWWLHGAMALIAIGLLAYRRYRNAYS